MSGALRFGGLVCLLAPVYLVAGAALAPAAAQQPRDQPECARGQVADMAVNCPDQFAWQRFVEVTTPVAPGVATFQSWSSDPDTFQCPPADIATCKKNPSAAGCPVWPSQPSASQAHPVTQRSVRLQSSHPLDRSRGRKDAGAVDCWNIPPSWPELVYRNRATFQYIVDNGLWYVEALEAAFERGFVFNFPIDAIEVKTNWKPLTADEIASGRFFTWESGGQTLGLIAMHISTKDLPNWFWSTFEQADNLGRCDFLGCHDSFGSVPANIPPRPKELCQTYPAGELTPALEKMMAAAKLDPAFRHYRLKGAMTDFTTPTGSSVLVGNSITEAGFVQTASCMTCHARATIQATSAAPMGLSPYPNIAGFTPEGQSYNGTPNPEWYYSTNHPIRRWSVQTDFVWAIPFRANSLYSTASCCTNGPPSGSACQCQGAGVCDTPTN